MMGGPLIGGNARGAMRRPVASSGKAMRVNFFRETEEGMVPVPGSLFGGAGVRGVDVALVIATTAAKLEELAEGEPGVTFVALDWDGQEVHRACVDAAFPCPRPPLAPGEDCSSVQRRHAGPLTGTERYVAAGGRWADYGECGTCGSTVRASSIVGRACAAKAA